MAKRIVVFPVLRRRWAFSSVLESGADGKSIPVGSFRNLLQNMRSLPQNSDRVELMTQYVSNMMHEKFTSWGATPEGSIRSRIHRIGQRMLSRVAPSEALLKDIPKDTRLVEIIYPCGLNSRLVRRRLRHLAKSSEVVHSRYLRGSVALLPFSMLLGILPLPNVVLAWNLFRAYSHWRALQGSRRLNYLVTESGPKDGSQAEQVEAVNSVLNSKISESKIDHWVLVPSEKLSYFLSPLMGSVQPIPDTTVSKVSKEYSLDPLEIVKWRDQNLPIKSFL